MATRTQKIKVGIFLTGGLTLILTLFFMVSFKNRQPTDTYYIRFAESVSGLGKDCAILYQGVPVGQVAEVRVDEDNAVFVTVNIIASRVRLREGTVATLAIGNLMGGMQVELSGGPPGSPTLPPGSTIPSKPSMFENVTQNLPEILENIAIILAKIDKSIGDVQSDRLGALIRNSNDAVVSADKMLGELTAFLQTSRGSMVNIEYEVTQTMRRLRESVAQVQRTFNLLNENPASVIWGRSQPAHPKVR